MLPEIEASFIGEPNSVPILGGRWKVDASLLGLVRDDDEQDVNRLYASLGWQRNVTFDLGFVSTFRAHVESSLYNVNDRTGSQDNNDIKGNSSQSRGFGYIHAETRYPLVKEVNKAKIVIEPVAALTLSPDVEEENIPNEDSGDVQIDALGLLNPSRFPGVDGIEDRSHVTYGLRSGIHGEDGSFGEVFIGQSFRFDEDDNPFAVGSGLDDQSSDVVGEVKGNYKGKYRLDYRFQMDNENLASQRHEVDVSARINKLQLSSQYLFARAISGQTTDADESREQIVNAASYFIDDNWRIRGSARHDLGDDPGLREAALGIDYTGQCISVSLTGERTLTDDVSGDNGTEIFLRIGFKNLGELQTSSGQFNSRNENRE